MTMPKIPVKSFAAALPMWLLACLPASAETRVTVAGGRVTVIAKDATVQQILAEWARVGGMTIVNIDRVPGGPVSIELTNVSETEALDVLMRSVRGYIVIPRETPDDTRSSFERIVVMPSGSTSVGAAVAAPPPPPFVGNVVDAQGGGFSAGQPQEASAPASPAPNPFNASVDTGASGGPSGMVVNTPPPPGVGESAGPRPQQAASRPGSNGNGLAVSGVTSPGIVPPVAPGQAPVGLSPSETPDPMKGSATPGKPVPLPSRPGAATTP